MTLINDCLTYKYIILQSIGPKDGFIRKTEVFDKLPLLFHPFQICQNRIPNECFIPPTHIQYMLPHYTCNTCSYVFDLFLNSLGETLRYFSDFLKWENLYYNKLSSLWLTAWVDYMSNDKGHLRIMSSIRGTLDIILVCFHNTQLLLKSVNSVILGHFPYLNIFPSYVY